MSSYQNPCANCPYQFCFLEESEGFLEIFNKLTEITRGYVHHRSTATLHKLVAVISWLWFNYMLQKDRLLYTIENCYL